jgi:Tol biopolymer transport system component
MKAMARIVLAVLSLAVLGALAPSANATFPGRNNSVAFAQRSVTGDSVGPTVEHTRLQARRPGGTTVRTLVDCQLTAGIPSGGDCTGTSYGSPSYSPDGTRVVFDAGARIGVMAFDGSELTLLPAVTADDGDPAFSADGTRIVFTGANERGTTDLHVRALRGGPAQLIIHDAAEPAWSSRNVIAYVRSGNVYVARPSGGHRRFVTSGVSPDWSPHASKLVFVRPLARLTFDAPIGRMYEATPHGEGLRRIGRDDDALHPVWSPDGRWVSWESLESGVFAAPTRNSAAVREVALTQTSGESGSVASFDPAWRPLH